MVAIELASYYLANLGYKDADLILHSDNQGVIGAFQRGRSRNFQVNLSIRRTTLACLSHNLVIYPQYVNTTDNLADPVSRGTLGSNSDRLPTPPSIPGELSQFLLHV